jgi:hypothetical protein
MAAMLSRSGVRVFASSAKDSKPSARVVPKASLNSAPKMFKESGAEAPTPASAAAKLAFTITPFDDYKFASIREATVSVVWLLPRRLLLLRKLCLLLRVTAR